MSRHILRHDGMYEVVVGYDDPLDSFFAQVYDVQASIANDDEEILIVQTGLTPQDVTSSDACLASVTEYLTDADREAFDLLSSQLDEERSRRRPPTEFQRAMARQLAGIELP